MQNNSVYHDVLSPVKFLLRSVEVYPDKEAVIYNDNRYTYRDFYNRVNRLSNALKKTGIKKKDKVAFICPNTPPMLEAHYAVLMIGAVLVSINIRLSPGEISYIINHSDSKAVFVDNEFVNIVLPIINELKKVKTFVNICDISDEKPIDGMEYENFLNAGSDALVDLLIDDECQNATINYTSGTTGLPKGVMYHHRGAFLNAIGEILEFGITFRSNYLWTLPMFHCNGWCFTWGITSVGATHVCLRKVEPKEIYKLINKEKISHLCAAPIILISMSSYAEEKK